MCTHTLLKRIYHEIKKIKLIRMLEDRPLSSHDASQSNEIAFGIEHQQINLHLYLVVFRQNRSENISSSSNRRKDESINIPSQVDRIESRSEKIDICSRNSMLTRYSPIEISCLFAHTLASLFHSLARSFVLLLSYKDDYIQSEFFCFSLSFSSSLVSVFIQSNSSLNQQVSMSFY